MKSQSVLLSDESPTESLSTEQSRLGAALKGEDFQIEEFELEDLELGEELEIDDDDFDSLGLAPIEETPSGLRHHGAGLVQIENLGEEIDLSEEQMDPGEMNEKDAREAGYLDDDQDLEIN